MKLIIGLGNPEEKYKTTRHNVGFTVLDDYAAAHDVTFIPKTKFKATIAEFSSGTEKTLLVKPTTYYNLSGEAVRLLTDFYDIEPQDILIIQDELALPFGTIRARRAGSHAGNNGIKSVSLHVGDATARVRIGISNSLLEHQDAADFVLGHFSKEETEQLEAIKNKATEIINNFIADSFEPTTYVL